MLSPRIDKLEAIAVNIDFKEEAHPSGSGVMFGGSDVLVSFGMLLSQLRAE
jgi:hypothetical protein